jgi:DNA modification methylase
MTPYYQDKHCTIYHGDCRDVLPTLEPVDLVLTDPPYGIGEAAGLNKSRGNLAIAKDYGNSTWDDERVPSDLICLAIGGGKNAVVFGGNYYTDILSQNTCWLVWDKQNGENDFADCELAWTTLPGAVRRISYVWNGMIKQRPEQRFHPTQKPIGVMSWCIATADTKTKAKAETILDPFMGSGTTLRAAKDLGRKAIGIELEEKYCEIAAKRLQQEVFDFS